MYLPNIITICRIALVPVVVWLMLDGRMQTAFLLFLVAGISDGVDGFLAKKYGWQTELGAHLDPLADKALLVSIYVVLGLFSHIPTWLVVAVVSRDILIVGAILLSWLMARPVPMRPFLISKINTASQIALAALVMGNLGFQLGMTLPVQIMIWIVGALTVFSAAAYLVAWFMHMVSYEEPRARQQSQAKPQRQSGKSSKGKRTMATSGKESIVR